MSGAKKFIIYAYDGIPADHIELDNPLLMPKARQTKVPSCLRTCWTDWKMDSPENFTRFERCKTFIPVRSQSTHLPSFWVCFNRLFLPPSSPLKSRFATLAYVRFLQLVVFLHLHSRRPVRPQQLIPPLIAFILATIVVIIWPFRATAFTDLDIAWSRAPILEVRPIVPTPAQLQLLKQHTDDHAARQQQQHNSWFSSLLPSSLGSGSGAGAPSASNHPAASFICPEDFPYWLSSEQELSFQFLPSVSVNANVNANSMSDAGLDVNLGAGAGAGAGDAVIHPIKTSWPVAVFMGVVFCAKLSPLEPAATRARAFPGPGKMQCRVGEVLCGQDSCYPVEDAALPDFKCPITSFTIQEVPGDAEPTVLEWDWHGSRWMLIPRRDGPSPLAHTMFAVGQPPLVCRNQVRAIVLSLNRK